MRHCFALLLMFSALTGEASAQCLKLVLGGNLTAAPGQGIGDNGMLSLGAAGSYTFTFTRSGSLVQNLQIGDSPSNGLPLVAPNKSFTYTVPRPFSIAGYLAAGSCSAPQETVVISFFNIVNQLVCKQTVTIKCVVPAAVLTFNNALSGSGSSTTDPARFNSPAGPVLINGSGSQNASSYRLEVQPANGGNIIGRELTPQERTSIGNFNLATFVPPNYFEAGKSYTVKLTTLPAVAVTTKTFMFLPATPAFSMTDRSGTVIQATNPDAPGHRVAPIAICPGKMIVNAAATSGQSRYLLIVHESDANWNRTGKHEWEHWFTGKASNGMNLDDLIAQNPDGLKPPKTPFTLTGSGFSTHLPPRYYRIGIATNEPVWQTRYLLVRVGSPLECSEGPTDPCPRTAQVPWSEIVPELKRLFLVPCVYSRSCLNESERQLAPLPGGPHKAFVWKGALDGNPPMVDVATQNQIIAGMQSAATSLAPTCSSGAKKVPVSIDIETEFVAGQPDPYRVYMNIIYACCGQ